MGERKKVLVVDDGHGSTGAFSKMLSAEGYDVFEHAEAETAVDMIPMHDIAAVITDDQKNFGDGSRLSEYLVENFPNIPVILLTGYGNQAYNLAGMIPGVFCHFKKPPDYACLKEVLDRAVELRFLKKEVEELKQASFGDLLKHRIIGSNFAVRKIREMIDAVKDSDSNVLIHGEAGSGKELVARGIIGSGKKGRPFVVLNCAVMPKELMELELFGWEKGAFPGTFARRPGKLEDASGGTLYLDEVGELELSLQAKLLRVLQENELQRPGSSRKIRVNFRLLSSTRRDLRKEIQVGSFREDFFYRISQVEIKVPPLRERKDDIPLLASAFCNEFALREKKVIAISDKVMKTFEEYHWPENVRELKNVVERAVILARRDRITCREIPAELTCSSGAVRAANNLFKTFRELEKEALMDALHACNGNKSKASRLLGISRKAMYKRLREIRL